jgi:parallel beta-helix repeat protein
MGTIKLLIIFFLASFFIFSMGVARADITTGLVGYWKFDEGSGTTAGDSSGSNNNATLRNGPLWTIGRVGQSLYFDGVNDYVLKTSPSWNFVGNPTKSFTVSVWFYPTTCVAISGIALASEGSWSGDLRLGTTNNLWFIQLIPGNTHADGGSCLTNQWHHVTGVYNAGETKLYLYYNGVLADSKVITNVDTSGLTDRLNVGFCQDYFNGLIDEVRVYSRALSTSDVSEIYNSAGTPPPPDTTPPTTPTNLAAAAVSYDRINLSWTASTDNTLLIGYRIYRGGVQIANTTNTYYSNSGLTPSTTYTYTVSAYDFAGNEGSQSTPASATTNAPDVTPPTTPTNLAATAVSYDRINLSWTASTDNVGVIGYRIYRGGTKITNTTNTYYSDADLFYSTTYTYTVSAYDGAGNEGSQSLPVSATTPAAPGGGTYYVSTTGNDSNPGTQALPWKTIQKAANTMVAGDTVIVLAGNYSSQRVSVTTFGSAGAPITYQAQGNVLMKGFRIDANYITVKGFEAANTDYSRWREYITAGVYVLGHHVIVENNTVHDSSMYGIIIHVSMSDFDYSFTHDCIVRNNRVYRNGMAGIAVFGTNNLVEGNEVWGSIQCHPTLVAVEGPGCPNYPDLQGLDADGMRHFGYGHVFRNNYIHDIWYSDPGNPGSPHTDAFQTWTALPEFRGGTNILFEKNLIILPDYKEPGAQDSGWMLAQATNITIRNNIVIIHRGTESGGGGCSNITVVNNVFVGNLSYLISNWPVGISLEEAPYSTVKNNIVYNWPGQAIYLTGASFTGLDEGNNLAFNSDGSIPSTYYNHSKDIWAVDPKFVNPAARNYRLQLDSPAINAGYNLAGLVTEDYDGNARPQGAGYDIGPFEYVSATQPIPGDLNNDTKVDIIDLGLVANHFGQTNMHPQWNVTADIVANNEIDIFDIVFVASRFTT